MDDVTYNLALSVPGWLACLHCDLLQEARELEPGETARCARCHEPLWRRRRDAQSRALAFALTAGVLYLLANLVPMLGLTVVGRQASTTVFGGAEHLWDSGQTIVAALVLLTVVIAPALQIIVTLAILLGACLPIIPNWVGTLLRHQHLIQTWSMFEVMLLGVIVALVKIADYATVVPGIALYALGGLVVALAAMQVNFEPREIWPRLRWRAPLQPAAAPQKFQL